MKNTLISLLAFVMSISSIHAVQFRWNNQAVMWNGVNVGSGQEVNLILLTGSSFNFVSYFDDMYTVIDTATTASGMSAGRIGWVTKKIGDMPTDNPNGKSYTVILEREVSGVTYYNVSTYVFTVSGIVDNSTTITDQNFTFNFGAPNNILKTWGSIDDGAQFATEAEAWAAAYAAGGSGWTSFSVKYIAPIPEPATAGLALAGLALLFRRKRK